MIDGPYTEIEPANGNHLGSGYQKRGGRAGEAKSGDTMRSAVFSITQNHLDHSQDGNRHEDHLSLRVARGS